MISKKNVIYIHLSVTFVNCEIPIASFEQRQIATSSEKCVDCDFDFMVLLKFYKTKYAHYLKNNYA